MSLIFFWVSVLNLRGLLVCAYGTDKDCVTREQDKCWFAHTGWWCSHLPKDARLGDGWIGLSGAKKDWWIWPLGTEFSGSAKPANFLRFWPGWIGKDNPRILGIPTTVVCNGNSPLKYRPDTCSWSETSDWAVACRNVPTAIRSTRRSIIERKSTCVNPQASPLSFRRVDLKPWRCSYTHAKLSSLSESFFESSAEMLTSNFKFRKCDATQYST